MNGVKQDEAIDRLERGQEALGALFFRLTDAQMEQPATIGGGDWSAKDLLGHVAAWEERAIQTVEAWQAGRPLPWETDSLDTDAFNAQVYERTSRQALEEVRQHARRTHAALVGAISGLTDDGWSSARGNRPLGETLGQITGGPAGPFRHAFDHLDDLTAYVKSVSG